MSKVFYMCLCLCVCNIDEWSGFSKELDFQRANDLITLNSNSTFYFPRNCMYAIMRILSKYRLLLGEIFVKTNNNWQRIKRRKMHWIFFSWKRDVKTKSVRTTERLGRRIVKKKKIISEIAKIAPMTLKEMTDIDASRKGTEN